MVWSLLDLLSKKHNFTSYSDSMEMKRQRGHENTVLWSAGKRREYVDTWMKATKSQEQDNRGRSSSQKCFVSSSISPVFSFSLFHFIRFADFFFLIARHKELRDDDKQFSSSWKECRREKIRKFCQTVEHSSFFLFSSII